MATVASQDFAKQVAGYGLTTANILYRRPDHPWLLQTYVWQAYDLCPNFPELQRFLEFWRKSLEGDLHSVHGGALTNDQAGGIAGDRRGVPAALSRAPGGVRRGGFQVSAPTMAPIRHVVSVPETIDLKPSDTTSSRRSGAMVARPPIMMPRLPKFAKPHIA